MNRKCCNHGEIPADWICWNCKKLYCTYCAGIHKTQEATHELANFRDESTKFMTQILAPLANPADEAFVLIREAEKKVAMLIKAVEAVSMLSLDAISLQYKAKQQAIKKDKEKFTKNMEVIKAFTKEEDFLGSYLVIRKYYKGTQAKNENSAILEINYEVIEEKLTGLKNLLEKSTKDLQNLIQEVIVFGNKYQAIPPELRLEIMKGSEAEMIKEIRSHDLNNYKMLSLVSTERAANDSAVEIRKAMELHPNITSYCLCIILCT